MRNIPETNWVRLCPGGEGGGWAGAWFTSNVMKRPHSIHPDHHRRGGLVRRGAVRRGNQEWTRPRWLGWLAGFALMGPWGREEKLGR